MSKDKTKTKDQKRKDNSIKIFNSDGSVNQTKENK
jgi:hypothetical protein